MLRRITLISVLLCLTLLQAPAFAKEPKLKIGFIVSLTGPVAAWGTAVKNGVELAREEHPEIDQVFQVIYEDSQYVSKIAVSNLQKLRSIDKVDAVYVFGGPMGDTLSPIAERMKLPMFTTEYNPRYTRGKKYVIRFANNASDYAEAILSTLRARKLKRFGIVKVENQYHNTLSSAFIESISKDESVEVLRNFKPDETDFRSIFPLLRQRNFDAIGVYISPTGHNAFFAQARSAGIRFNGLFGTNGFESNVLNQGVEEVVEGALFANTTVDPDFRTRYQQRFGSIDQLVDAALAYEFAVLVKDLFRGQPKPDSPEAFLSKFALTSSRNGICGKYFYRNSPETGQYFSFPMAVGAMQAGQPVLLTTRQAP